MAEEPSGRHYNVIFSFNFSYHHYNAVFLHQNHVFKTKQLLSDFFYILNGSRHRRHSTISQLTCQTQCIINRISHLLKLKLQRKSTAVALFLFLKFERTHKWLKQCVILIYKLCPTLVCPYNFFYAIMSLL